MTDHPLSSSRLKIERAKKHFIDLQSEVQAFTDRNPYKVLTDKDSEPAITIHKLQILEPVPVTLSPVIGDLLHNLMSALDSVATALVKAKGITEEGVLQHTYFPIHWRKEDFATNDRTIAFFKNAGPDVEKIIKRIEPHKGGRGETLVRLKNLNNRDKHRAIIPVLSSVGQVTFRGSGVLVSMPEQPPKLVSNLKDGDELLRVAFHEPHYSAETHFTFYVGIDEFRPLFNDMKELIDVTKGVVDLINIHFFQFWHQSVS